MSPQNTQPVPNLPDSSTINVRILPTEIKADKRFRLRRHWPWVLLTVLTMVVLTVWAVFIISVNSHSPTALTPKNRANGINVGLITPKYLFVGNESTVEVTMTNHSGHPFSGTAVLVFFSGSHPTFAGSGNSYFTIEALPDKAEYTCRFNFVFNQSPYVGKTGLRLIVRAEGENEAYVHTPWIPLDVAPRPCGPALQIGSGV